MVATIRQSDSQTAWSQLMEKYPTLNLCLQAVGDALIYVINGQLVNDLWHWTILTSGNISEAAMMFAALWVTAASIEPAAINSLPYGIPGILSTGSMFALTLLPEIIVYHAIAVCYRFWRSAIAEKNYSDYVWSTLYTIPTLSFLIMTVYTLSTFVSIGHTFTAPTWMLTARCLSGWSYGVVCLIHAAISRQKDEENGTKLDLNVNRNAVVTTIAPVHSQAAVSLESLEQIAEQEEAVNDDYEDAANQMFNDDDIDNIIDLVAEQSRNTGKLLGTDTEENPIACEPVGEYHEIVPTTPRRKPYTIAEASEEIGYSERYIRTLATQGKLTKVSGNDNLVTAASVRAYQAGKR